MEALAIILIIITWLSFAIIASIIGDAKGGDAVGWFFYGLFFGMIAVAHAIVRHRTLAEEQNRHRLAGRIACRLCDEYISPNAVVCPFCQRNIERYESSAAQPAAASKVGNKTPSTPTSEMPEADNGSDRINLIIGGVVGVVAILVLLWLWTSN